MEKPLTTDPGFPASEPLENQGLQEPKSVLTKSPRQLRFEEVNPVTLKLTDGRGSLVPTCHGYWSGYSTTRAIAWLMGIGNGRWIVRYRNKSSRPMKLPAAKKYALEMVKGVRPGRVVTDPIGELNAMQAVLAEYEAANNPNEDDSKGLTPYVWPEEARNPLHGSNPDGSTPGALQGDDYPLTYDADGNVELPACLDRRKPKLAEVAA
jgi:hypothetical protein